MLLFISILFPTRGSPVFFLRVGVHHATRLALAAVLGLALGILSTRLEAHETFAVPALTILVVGFSLLIDNDTLRRIMHVVGVVLCWICVAHNFGGVFGEFMESYCSWWFGTFLIFHFIDGMSSFPLTNISHIFQDGEIAPPTRLL